MRVVLDLDTDGTNHLSGTVTYAGNLESEGFDGWLELMRLLEQIARPADGPQPGQGTARVGGPGRC